MFKKVIAIILTVILLAGCGGNAKKDTPATDNSSNNYRNSSTAGVWISYNEIVKMLKSKDGFKEEFKKVIDNCKLLGISELYVHTRANCDSLYPSDYFPLYPDADLQDFDVFRHIIDTCAEEQIKVHAWINPLRVTTSTNDVTKLDKYSPAYKWLNDDNKENDKNVMVCESGIYLNPASEEVGSYIFSAIQELLTRYTVAGVHFDDYFYPSSDADYDKESYEYYKQYTSEALSLTDWRCLNINSFIANAYSLVKSYSPNLIFSVSPAADIEHNYTEFGADVAKWVKNGIVDVIIPQLYFGFEYPDEDYAFENILKEWKALAKANKKVKLVIGLAPYKIGSDSRNDEKEWKKDDDILARQVAICHKDNAIAGYNYFSYTSLFSEEELNTKQRENVLETLQKLKK